MPSTNSIEKSSNNHNAASSFSKGSKLENRLDEKINASKLRYFLFNKPYGVLCQFTDKDGRKTIGDYFNFPKDVYPVGRLDLDSEGLLLLTNDKKLIDYILNSGNKHEREYYVQVEGIPDASAIKQLEEGVEIEGKVTLPAFARIIDDPNFSARTAPIRVRKTVPAAWISLTLIEGRNRQVRKMTASVGYPTLRLVRVRLLNLTLNDLKPGKVKEIPAKNFYLHK